jgi:hypothetical protein
VNGGSTHNAKMVGKSVKSMRVGMYMNHLLRVEVGNRKVGGKGRTPRAYGIRCGWNHSVKMPALSSNELVLINLGIARGGFGKGQLRAFIGRSQGSPPESP